MAGDDRGQLTRIPRAAPPRASLLGGLQAGVRLFMGAADTRSIGLIATRLRDWLGLAALAEATLLWSPSAVTLAGIATAAGLVGRLPRRLTTLQAGARHREEWQA